MAKAEAEKNKYLGGLGIHGQSLLKPKRPVNVISPLQEGVWISAEQLDASRAKFTGKSEVNNCSLSGQVSDVPTCEYDKLIYSRVSGGVENEVSGLTAEASSGGNATPLEAGHDSYPATTVDTASLLWTQSEQGMTRMDSCHSSQSSQSYLSFSSRWGEEQPSAWTRGSYRNGFAHMTAPAESEEDVHTAARRSLEQSSRSSLELATSPQVSRKRLEKSSILRRMLKSSLTPRS